MSYVRFSQLEVKASGSLPVHNLSTGLDYSTIQEAIDANETLNGNSIKVDAGTYYEQVTINKSITLAGQNRDTTIIDGNGKGLPMGHGLNATIAIETWGVNIFNLTVRNAGSNFEPGKSSDACVGCVDQTEIDIENDVFLNAGKAVVLGPASFANVSDNIISDIAGMGIDVGIFARNVTVSNNVVYNCGYCGINLDGDVEYCGIINNTVENGYNGIELAPNVNTNIVPTNNFIAGNMLANNSGVNMLIGGSSYHSQASYTNTFRWNNITNSQHYNLVVLGYNPATFMQDIDSSNTANNKRIYYFTNVSNAEIDPTNSPDAGFLALVNCTNTAVKDFDFDSNNDGIFMAYSLNCTLTNMTIQDNRVCITNTLFNESYFSNYGGLTLLKSQNNVITNSKMCNNTCGVCLCNSNNNTFYNNAFVANGESAVTDRDTPFENVSTGYFSANFWDNGIEGNYWSDYLTKYPNATQVDSSGVWNTPYAIDTNNTDHFPLTVPYAMILEFASSLVLSLFMIVTLLTVVIYKKKAVKNKVQDWTKPRKPD